MAGLFIKLDVNFWDHPKVVEAGQAAAVLYQKMTMYCFEHATDGVISRPQLRHIAAKSGPNLVQKLVAVGLVEVHPEGWFLPGYVERYKSSREVADLRRKRRAAGLKGGRPKAICFPDGKANGNQIGFTARNPEVEEEIEIEEASSEVYPRGPAPASDDDDPTGPAKKLWAAAGIARPTPTTGDARTVAKATARGWTIQDLEAKAARAAAAEHDPLAYLRQVLTAAANEDPPTERATPAGGESWQTAWAEVSRHASAGVTRWGQVDELSPRARAAARAARQTIRYGTSSEAKWAFRDAWMAAEPQEASA